MIAGRRATVLLVVCLISLALNLFVGGLLLGRGLRTSAVADGEKGGPFGLTALVPAAARPIVREQLRAHRPEIERQLRALRAARRDAFTSLKADPFDTGAAQAAFARLREQSLAVQELVQRLLVETAARTPPDVRAGWGPNPGGANPPP